MGLFDNAFGQYSVVVPEPGMTAVFLLIQGSVLLGAHWVYALLLWKITLNYCIILFCYYLVKESNSTYFCLSVEPT
jgi:hypothetical protein